jgi:hypothetical protein
MKKLTLTAAFAYYGAKLKNTRWAYSAIADDGALVFSCWSAYSGACRPVIPIDVDHRFRSDLKSGRFAPESLADLFQNRWPIYIGFTGRFAPDYAP